ncbi:MAG: 50S ribosomal protein L10 [Promethearchaeota archaeon]|nr:MAG: 50S ribosomal protein L10 [Candidatus Lokiarchaeota archaeon]
MMSEKTIPQWKKDEIKYLKDLMEKYDNIIVIDVSNINDKQVQEMRKILRGKAVIRMSKKSLQQRALDKYQEESNKENLDELKESIPGQSGLIFTDIDPFELRRIFLENKWMVAAKPGQKTPVNIVVPAGDTGLPTGQVISELNMTLKLPTMIKNDTIHIREDTVTHKAGDTVSTKEASVLKKLGVEPIESILKIHTAWSDGDLIPEDIIYMDLAKFREEVASSYIIAQTIALELGIIDKETFEPLMQKANREAIALLFEMPFIDESFIEDYLKKAQSHASVMNAMIFGEGVASPPSGKPKTEEKKEEKKEQEEEDEVSGIGSLF